MSVIPTPDRTMTAAPALDDVERLQARLNALEQERKHLLAVIEILQEVSGSLHFADIVQSVALRLGETFGLDRCSIFLAERGGRRVRLVASYEDPGIRNYVVDLERYPELRRALQSAETVFIPEAQEDPMLKHVRGALAMRRVRSITVVPINWRGSPIGAIYLRTFRDGPAFSDADIRFCQVVASLTAKALRNAYRYEQLKARRQDQPEEAGIPGDDPAIEPERGREQDRAFQAGRFAALAHGRAQGLDVVQRDEFVSGNIDDLHEGRRLHGSARKGGKGAGGLR